MSTAFRLAEAALAALFFCRLAGIGQSALPPLSVLAVLLAAAHGAELLTRRQMRADLWRLVRAHRFALRVVALMALSCAVRLVGLNAELGHVPLDIDEHRLGASVQHYFATGELLHTTVEDHPGLAFWLFAGAAFASFIHSLSNGILVPPDHMPVEMVVAAARICAVLVAAATVAVTASVARRLTGEVAALLAGLVVAVAPLSVQSTTECRCDPVMVLAVVVAVQLALVARDRPSWGSFALAGAVAGAATGIKYSGAFALVPVLLSAGALPSRREASVAVLSALLSFLAAVAVTNDFVWSDVPNFLRQLHDQVFITGPGHWAASDNPRWFYVKILDRFGTGAGLLIVAAAYGAYTLATRRLSPWIVCSYPVLYMAFMTGRPSQFPRWVYPMLPFVAIAALSGLSLAMARIGSWERLSARQRTAGLAAVLAVGVMLFLQPLWAATVEVSRRAATPTHALAERWIREHAAPGAVVVVEDGWLDLTDSGLTVRRVENLRLVLNHGLDAFAGSDWVIVPEPNFGHPLLRDLAFSGRVHAENRFGAPNGYDYEFFTVPKR